MKIPVCVCGHTLVDHYNDNGKSWQKDGFCIVGYFDDMKFLGYGSGCPCPQFQDVNKANSVVRSL